MNRILLNKNIVITRAKDQAVETINQFESLGANVISFPTIILSTIKNDPYLDDTIKKINNFNSLIFTSENAVKSLLEKVAELNVSFDPKSFFVITIGDKTTKYSVENGFRVDFQSSFASSNSLIKELGYIDLIGRKVFIPNSNLSQKDQFDSLEEHGAEITAVPVYQNRVNDAVSLKDKIEILDKTNVDLYVFTSPSTFNGFIKILSITNPAEYFNGKNIAVIGPVTKKALNKVGIEPNIIPGNFTMNYLIEEIKKFFSKENVID